MSTLAYYSVLGLMGLTLLFALLGIASFMASHSGGHPRNKYLSKIFGGTSYVLLALLGMFGSSIWVGQQLWLLGALSILFGAMGGLMVRQGLKERKAAR